MPRCSYIVVSEKYKISFWSYYYSEIVAFPFCPRFGPLFSAGFGERPHSGRHPFPEFLFFVRISLRRLFLFRIHHISHLPAVIKLIYIFLSLWQYTLFLYGI